MLDLAIIAPLYNPHNDWFDAICDSISGLDSILINVDFSIVLVNDGSTNFDESSIKKIKERTNKLVYVSYQENKGKGFAIRQALNQTQARYYIYTDIDFPFGYKVIIKMYEILKSSPVNLIIGKRDKDYYNLLPLKRKILSKVLNKIIFLLTRFKVQDTQAGIKGFDNAGKEVFLATKINGFLFDLEFICGSLRKKLNYHIIGIQPRPNIRFSDFRTSIIKREFHNLVKIIFQS